METFILGQIIVFMTLKVSDVNDGGGVEGRRDCLLMRKTSIGNNINGQCCNAGTGGELVYNPYYTG